MRASMYRHLKVAAKQLNALHCVHCVHFVCCRQAEGQGSDGGRTRLQEWSVEIAKVGAALKRRRRMRRMSRRRCNEAPRNL